MNTPSSNELANLLFALVRSLHREMKNQKASPLNPSQMHALFFIRAHERPLMREIAECLSIKPPSATALVEELQTLGYVKREPDADDRRSVHIVLTPLGHQLIRMKFTFLSGYIETLIEPLSSEERKQFTSLLKKIIPPADQTLV